MSGAEPEKSGFYALFILEAPLIPILLWTRNGVAGRNVRCPIHVNLNQPRVPVHPWRKSMLSIMHRIISQARTNGPCPGLSPSTYTSPCPTVAATTNGMSAIPLPRAYIPKNYGRCGTVIMGHRNGPSRVNIPPSSSSPSRGECEHSVSNRRSGVSRTAPLASTCRGLSSELELDVRRPVGRSRLTS